MNQIKILILILNSLMIAWLLTDYNIFQYSFLNNLLLIVLSITWLKSYDLVKGGNQHD
jgi:hypothetical protein